MLANSLEHPANFVFQLFQCELKQEIETITLYKDFYYKESFSNGKRDTRRGNTIECLGTHRKYPRKDKGG